MKYLCLGYLNAADFSAIGEEAQAALMKECFAQCVPFRATGRVEMEEGLEESAKAKTIRPRNGRPTVTDGPFLDTKEQIGGAFVVDAPTMEEAIAVASLHPAALMGEEFGFGIEVRPIAGSDQPAKTGRRFMVAIHHPADYDGSKESEQMGRDIDALNEEMIAAGVREFAEGLQSPAKSKSVRTTAEGRIAVSDGPYLETKEHIGGFWVLRVADMEAALEWARKAAVACRAPVEVRPFY